MKLKTNTYINFFKIISFVFSMMKGLMKAQRKEEEEKKLSLVKHLMQLHSYVLDSLLLLLSALPNVSSA